MLLQLNVLHLCLYGTHNKIPIEKHFRGTGQKSGAGGEITSLIVIIIPARGLRVLVVVVVAVISLRELPEVIAPGFDPEHGGHHGPGQEDEAYRHGGRHKGSGDLLWRGGVG